MVNIHDAQNAIRLQVKHYCEMAESLYGVVLNPEIRFDLKGRTAGTAQTKVNGQQILRFNLAALYVEGGWDHLYNDTVPHEVAHLVQYNNLDWPKSRKANPPHGRYWKGVMNQFGVKADRCHSLPLPKARQQRKWKYACSCKTWELSTTRHNKIRRGTSYSCPTCKTRLTYGAARASNGMRQAL